ncbi:heterokaryon incompatibility protein [Colletotrichum asianum]|uniref:Heterokaryon incompatibility protein n=1 Tax=Colletotrichum asianum TaxID=702518 RepID=A0A8H3W1L3_9PEZI|nr:heterokaryon incompatibility protein [Colletotrichum asianum]
MSISMARGWHSNCKATHVQCGLRRTSGSRTWRPTRLISFATSPENEEDIFRLVDGSTLPDDAEYVALSHCWGKVHLIRLLSSTEAGLRAGYPMTQLPKTFREAIQDSAEDWQKEAQTMKLVYGQGAITLAAANASDSTKGMFTQRDVNGIIPPIVSCSWEDGRTLDYCVVDMHLRKDNVEQSNLATRAWTVQERVLSPRLLSFGQTQMFYQCLEGEFCESFPLGVPNFMVPTKTYHIHGTDADPRRAWSSIVETYSRAELTKDSDKFMAFSGIAEAMEHRLGDRYLAGLWQDNLLIELLWSTMHAEKHRPTPCMAPTWSWLSTNSVILTKTQIGPQSVRRQLATVTGTGVDLVDPSYPYGNIHPGAILQLRGRLKPAEWDQVDDYAAKDFRRYQVTCDGFHETRSSLLTPRTRPTSHLRIKVDERPGLDLTHLKISLLPIIVFAGREADSDRVEGIVLTPKDAAAGVYERVAHFSASQKLAAYLFLEKITRSGSQNASERFGRELVKPNDVVDGFSFKGPGRWMKIEERDLLIV